LNEAPSKFFKQQEIDFAQSKPAHPLIADSDHSGYNDFRSQGAKPLRTPNANAHINIRED